MVSQEGACPSSCRSAILGAGSRPRTNLRSDDSLAETCRVQSRIVRGRNSRTELGATQGPTRLCVRGRRREVCAARLPVDQNTCDRRAGGFGRSFGGADAMDGLRGGVAGVRHPNGARFPRRLAVWAVSLAGGVWGSRGRQCREAPFGPLHGEAVQVSSVGSPRFGTDERAAECFSTTKWCSVGQPPRRSLEPGFYWHYVQSACMFLQRRW